MGIYNKFLDFIGIEEAEDKRMWPLIRRLPLPLRRAAVR